MQRVILIVALAIGLYAWNTKQKQDLAMLEQQSARTPASHPDRCADKKYCAVVYVAPWCPACNQIAPQLKRALDRSREKTEFGLRIVVGQGAAAKNLEKATFYGEGAVVDDSNVHFKALGVTQFPSFFVLDAKQSILFRDQLAFDWINQRLN